MKSFMLTILDKSKKVGKILETREHRVAAVSLLVDRYVVM